MRRILVILTFLALAASALPQMVYEVKPWDYVCESIGNVYSIDNVCEGISPPLVIYSDVINIGLFGGNLNGLYIPGEPYVFVSPLGTNVVRTIEHEMVHYLTHEAGLIGERDMCEHERVARFVSGQSWEQKIRDRYGCQKDDT